MRLSTVWQRLFFQIHHIGYSLGFIPKKSQDTLRSYWENPPDEGNKPECYATSGQERSIFLVELVRSLSPQPVSILEIGCNVGRNLNALLEAGYFNLTGIEINSKALVAMENYFPNLAKVVTTINKPAELALSEFNDQSFDLVYTMAVLQHLPSESEEIFKQIYRVTKTHFITVEDEKEHWWGHFPRDYGKIFSNLGMRQEVNIKGTKMEEIGLSKNFNARIFKKCGL